MDDEKFQVIYETAGSFTADIYRGFLEAQGIPVFLSQEGLGHSSLSLTVGSLGRVQLLVHAELADRAREILADFESGTEGSGRANDFSDDEQGNGGGGS